MTPPPLPGPSDRPPHTRSPASAPGIAKALPVPPPPSVPVPHPLTTVPNTGRKTGLVLALFGGCGVLATSAGIVFFWFLSKKEVASPPSKLTGEPVETAPKIPEDPASVGPKALDGEQVHKRLLKSTAFIVTTRSVGSGVLVHGPRRLVMTNYHVVNELPAVAVFFPAYRNGELIPQTEHYVANAKSIGLRAKVVARNSRQDLALVELERVPEGVIPLPLSAKPVGIGAKLYSVGASGIEVNTSSGTLWRLSDGIARGRNRGQVLADGRQVIEAMFLETQKPINAGDSGGPTVNDAGNLVGIVSLSDPKRDTVKLDIDLTEVRTFLDAYATKSGFKWDAPVADGPSGADDPKVVTRLAAGLRDPDASRRLAAARAMIALGPDARPFLAELIAKLDDPDERVRRAVEEVLNATGTPGPTDALHFEKALVGSAPHARRYALTVYSRQNGLTLPETLVTPVIEFLTDPATEVRRNALTALKGCGPGCKAQALAAVMTCFADPDPGVVELAVSVVVGWVPLATADQPALIAGLEHPKPIVRRFATNELGALAPDVTTAMKWLRPRLADTEPAVVAAAVDGIARWGREAKACLPDLIRKADDSRPLVATAALTAVAKVGLPADVLPLLVARVQAPETADATRQAASEAILALDLPDATVGVPAIAILITAKSAATRTAALDRLAGYKSAAAPAVRAMTECLRDEDADVKKAALGALAAVGRPAASSIPFVARLADPSAPAAQSTAAIRTLARLGPKAVEPLADILTRARTEASATQAINALARFEGEARPIVLDVLAALAKPAHPLAEARQKRLDAVEAGKSWKPDPASEALARIGGDELVKRLASMTEFEFKVANGVKVKRATTAPDLKVQYWAVVLLAEVDPDTLTAEGKAAAAKKLKYLASYDPHAGCRQAAKAGAARYDEVK